MHSSAAARHSANSRRHKGYMLNQVVDKMEGTVQSSDALFEHQQVASHFGQKFPIWTSQESGHNIDMRKRIFCNRSLNMKSIVAIGFDMDYTLAQYKPETFETLTYNGTVNKLVYDLGYPEEVCYSLPSALT
ncbi:hypothetical protein SUGI_0536470 [Cryptomeria japonica]|nr:hypothetical protein SUGI_0536470 [Cryptomeria japonica]